MGIGRGIILRKCEVQVKVKWSIAVRRRLIATGTHVPYGITQVITCYPAEVTFPPLPQPKLVLD